MTERKLYGATFGPYLYDDTDSINDPDGDFANFTEHASQSDGGHLAAFYELLDSDQSHGLKIYWNEDDSSHRTLALLVAGGNRSLTLYENLSIADGFNVTIQALGQANQLTLNEGFTIGDGFAGTLTFSAASKTLTVEDDSAVNQDLTTDASPKWASIALGAEDSAQGVLTAYGADTGSTDGGKVILETAADHDNTINSYAIQSYKDVLYIGPDTDADSVILDSNGDLYVTAGSIVLPKSEYLNFGGTQGSGGYGFRDNAGQMEVKDSGGAWTDITGLSDLRYKMIMGESYVGLDFITKLVAMKFVYKDEDKNYPGRLHDGFIGQQVKQVLDELGIDFSGWFETKDGVHHVKLDKFVVPLVNAIKAQQSQINNLTNDLRRLRDLMET